ncbi:uncharacterized protein EI90DRAFT_3122481 [Cantharellus anzutake]|uniref:uncharacterized protein n=1 Tax=Cantharellus anzutake TaxID=1750568 RepID=UPI0019060F37|nr:uncharacterized protein EI90DRAFT_3122481 [Cantharellus anzutake]KAF8332746.1 hypothetical protein EI90DRAFT_3122481 [Cantharellus anzutake]
MPPAPVPEKTPCNTIAEWNQHVKDALEIIEQPETEENWNKMERCFLTLASIVRGGAYKLEADFLPGMRSLSRPTCKAIISDRTRLSGPAVELVSVVGARLGPRFEPLIPLYLPTVLKLCTKPSKIYISRGTSCLKLLATHCRMPAIISQLRLVVVDKSQTLRIAVADALYDFLSTSSRDGAPRPGKWIDDVELMIKTFARDASPEARQFARRACASYIQLWPERMAGFAQPLSPTTRRYLDINDSTNTAAVAQPLKATSHIHSASGVNVRTKYDEVGASGGASTRSRPLASHARTLSGPAAPASTRAPAQRSVTQGAAPRPPSRPPSRPESRHNPRPPSHAAAPVYRDAATAEPLPPPEVLSGRLDPTLVQQERQVDAVFPSLPGSGAYRTETRERRPPSRTGRPVAPKFKPTRKEKDVLDELLRAEDRQRGSRTRHPRETPLPDSDSESDFGANIAAPSSRLHPTSKSRPHVAEPNVAMSIPAQLGEVPKSSVNVVDLIPQPNVVAAIGPCRSYSGAELETTESEKPQQSGADAVTIDQVTCPPGRNARICDDSDAGTNSGGSTGINSNARVAARAPGHASTKPEATRRPVYLNLVHRAPGFRPTPSRDARVEKVKVAIADAPEPLIQPRKASKFGVAAVVAVPGKPALDSKQDSVPNSFEGPMRAAEQPILKQKKSVSTLSAKVTASRSASGPSAPKSVSSVSSTSSAKIRQTTSTKPFASSQTPPLPPLPPAFTVTSIPLRSTAQPSKLAASATNPVGPEGRTRNATATTASQAAKQKPPVRRPGFVPSSKTRPVSGPAPGPHRLRKTASITVSKKTPEVQMAVNIPLPPSPKMDAAPTAPQVPLPRSLKPVGAQPVVTETREILESMPLREPAESDPLTSKDRPPLFTPPIPNFPTIESLKTRLSDVLENNERQSLAPAGLPIHALSVKMVPGGEGEQGALHTEALQIEEIDEGEFRLAELEVVETQPAVSAPASHASHSPDELEHASPVDPPIGSPRDEPAAALDTGVIEEPAPPMLLSELNAPSNTTETGSTDIGDDADNPVAPQENIVPASEELKEVEPPQVTDVCEMRMKPVEQGENIENTLPSLFQKKRSSLDGDLESQKRREYRAALGDVRVNVRHSLA